MPVSWRLTGIARDWVMEGRGRAETARPTSLVDGDEVCYIELGIRRIGEYFNASSSVIVVMVVIIEAGTGSYQICILFW